MGISKTLEESLCAWRRRIREQPDSWKLTVIVRNGRSRTLRVPCKGLKAVQRSLNHDVLQVLDRERASYCRAGRGVLKAAVAHERRPALLHRDIARFFPSVSSNHVVRTLIGEGFSPYHARLLASVCTLDDELPQGAPTSVTLGNLVLKPLDRRLSVLCKKFGLTYTRYVDDLAISGGEVRLRSLAPHIDRIIANEGWLVGQDKGGLFGRGEYREYLGISVGGFLEVGKKTAERVVAHFADLESGKIDLLTFRQLTGWARAVRASSYERRG